MGCPDENTGLRVFPDQWLKPFDFAACFEDPDRPFEIDLGCGMGRFLLAHAAKTPDVNFLGIDRQLNRIRKIEKKTKKRNLTNIRLFRADGFYATAYLVPPRTVDTYYIFYPDPWPKGKHRHNRLFNEPFIHAVARTLKPGGKLHVSTDHRPYFDQIFTLISNDSRFGTTETFYPSEDETSDFERIFADKKPQRCSFILLSSADRQSPGEQNPQHL